MQTHGWKGTTQLYAVNHAQQPTAHTHSDTHTHREETTEPSAVKKGEVNVLPYFYSPVTPEANILDEMILRQEGYKIPKAQPNKHNVPDIGDVGIVWTQFERGEKVPKKMKREFEPLFNDGPGYVRACEMSSCLLFVLVDGSSNVCVCVCGCVISAFVCGCA